MAADLFEELLGLEDKYYQEGYDSGIADSAYAGFVEGKVFGIEKGYEKALELAKLHGRGLIWQLQTIATRSSGIELDDDTPGGSKVKHPIISQQFTEGIGKTQTNTRLQKHIDFLLNISNGIKISSENNDDAVAQFDEQLTKAKARAKMISNIVGDNLSAENVTNDGIEDATGLNARH